MEQKQLQGNHNPKDRKQWHSYTFYISVLMQSRAFTDLLTIVKFSITTKKSQKVFKWTCTKSSWTLIQKFSKMIGMCKIAMENLPSTSDKTSVIFYKILRPCDTGLLAKSESSKIELSSPLGTPKLLVQHLTVKGGRHFTLKKRKWAKCWDWMSSNLPNWNDSNQTFFVQRSTDTSGVLSITETIRLDHQICFPDNFFGRLNECP